MKDCYNCAWLSDKFVSVCCNHDSQYCGDFVSVGYVCQHWKEGNPPETPEEWKEPKEK